MIGAFDGRDRKGIRVPTMLPFEGAARGEDMMRGNLMPRRLSAVIVGYLPVALLMLLPVVLGSRYIADGTFRYSDEVTHAMDGAFVRDAVVDLPLSISDPFDYAADYYAHYPALGIPFYYPPFFALVEAALFGIFGIHIVVARMTVIAFAVFGVLMAYLLLKLIAGKPAALLGAGLFIALPEVVYWTRQVMLEVPTVAMMLASCYFFYRYAELRHRPSALWAGMCTVGAVLTKQPALFIIPAFAAYLCVRRRWDLFREWQFWMAATIIAAALVPYFWFTFQYANLLVAGRGIGIPAFLDGTPFLVLKSWGRTLSWPLLAATLLAGIGAIAWKDFRRRMPGVWLLGFAVVFFLAESAYLRMADPRGAVLVAPFLVGCIPILLAGAGMLKRPVVVAGGVIVILAFASYSYVQGQPVVRGYEEAAEFIVRQNGSGPFLLYEGYKDRDLCFFARQHDDERKAYFLRGSKMLYACASEKRYSYQEVVVTDEALLEFIQRYGIRVIAVEDRDVVGTEPGKRLRVLLRESSQFDLAGSFPISAPGTGLDGLKIQVYVSRNPRLEPEAATLTIPLVGLSRILEVPLKGGGRPRLIKTSWKD